MNTVRTLSTTQHSSLEGPVFSSTLLRPSADGESRSYPTRGIAAALLLAGVAAVAALPIFAPRTVTIASDNGSDPIAVVLKTTEVGDATGSAVVGAVAHLPAVNGDDDALSFGSEDLVYLSSAPDQDAPGIEIAAPIVEEIAPATDGEAPADDSSDQGSAQTGDDQPSAGAAPADTSGTGESASDADGGEADTGGSAQGEVNGSGQGSGGGPSDNSQGKGPPQETPGNTPSGDNPGNGSPQGNPGGQSSGQGSGNGNGNGKK